MTPLAVLLVALAAQSQSQQPTTPAAPPAPAPAPAAAAPAPAPAHLPTPWHGTWRGPSAATFVAPGRPPVNFTMQLRVEPTDKPDRLTWEITYDAAAGKQVRPYELVATDAAASRFAIDEKNGIVIDAGLAASTLSSHFEVQDVMITASYRLETAPTERIVVELHSFRVDDPRSSGGGAGDAAAIPVVKSWRLLSIQRAELTRVPKTP